MRSHKPAFESFDRQQLRPSSLLKPEILLLHSRRWHHAHPHTLQSCSFIGSDAWPVSPRLISALRSVSGKLSHAMQASVSAAVLPTPLGFTTVRGLGLQEAHHLAGETWNTSFAVMSNLQSPWDSSSLLADAPCARECTKDVYPNQDNFHDCSRCGASHAFESKDLGSIEIVFTINYTRSSLLLGGVQSTLSTTCVSLLEEEGMTVHLQATWQIL